MINYKYICKQDCSYSHCKITFKSKRKYNQEEYFPCILSKEIFGRTRKVKFYKTGEVNETK